MVNKTGLQAVLGQNAESRSVLDFLPVAAYLCDAEGLITYCNSRAVALWGREPKLRDPEDRYCGSFRLYSSDGSPILHAECWMALALRDGVEYVEREIIVEQPDGRRRLAIAHANPLRDGQGVLCGAINVLVDITDQKEAEKAKRETEQRFTSFMAHLPAAAWIKDPAGRYTYANDYAQEIFGTPLEDLRGKTDLEVFPRATATAFRQNDQRVQESRQVVRRIESLEHAGDGVHESIVTKFPIFGAADEISAIGGVAIDVTEQRRATDALRESESKLRGLLDNTRACVFAKDLDGRYVIANKSMAELFGWPDESFALGKTDYELHTREAADSFVFNDRKVLAEGAPVEVEETVETPRGRRAYLVLKFPLRDANGRVSAVCGIGSDITERVRAQEALRESETRYRRLAELLPVGVYTCRAPEGTISYFNKEAARIWGRAPREGDTDERFCGSFRLFRPDGTLLPHDQCPMAVALRDGKEFRNEEAIVERPDGSRATARVNIDPIRDAEGRIVGAVNVFHDTTELREAQRKIDEEKHNLETLLETLPIGVLIAHDPECKRITGNPAATQLLRMRAGHNFSKTAPAGEDPKHFRVLKQGRVIPPTELPMQRAARGESISHEEIDHEFDDGTVIHSLISARPLLDAAGAPRGAVASVLDITDLKNAENALKDADRRKDEFLATLGHELRNPLAPIRMGLELVKMANGDTQKLQKLCGMMERQCEQLTTLVDDLLDVSRITRGKIELRKRPVKLTEVVSHAVEASRPWIDEAGHRLTVDAPEEGTLIDGDPNRLTQILANLLNNASKYTPSGGEIWLTAKREGRDAVVTVRDNGIGLPQDLANTVFEMFTQLETPRGIGRSGLGIGLTLVKQLVEMHGGQVVVRSAGAGQGSTFTVRLPALNEVPIDDELVSSSAGRDEQKNGKRMIVADDNKDAADALSILMEQLGYEVRTAYDGEQAVAVAAEFRPDVILMDLAMPGLDGYQAARRIRVLPWAARVQMVALSGWGQEHHKTRAAEAGFDHHLVKPIATADIVRILATNERGAAGLDKTG